MKTSLTAHGLSGKPPQQNPAPEWVHERQGFASLVPVIADMKGVIKRLKEHGVKPLSEESGEVRRGVFALYSLDPEGNLVHLSRILMSLRIARIFFNGTNQEKRTVPFYVPRHQNYKVKSDPIKFSILDPH